MIGIFNDNFPPILDGVALTAQNYAYWLHEKGHDVRVITDYAPNMKEVIQAAPYPINFVPSIPIPFRHPYRYGLPYMSPLFMHRFRRMEFEIVHAHCPFITGDLAYSAAQKQQILQRKVQQNEQPHSFTGTFQVVDLSDQHGTDLHLQQCPEA